MHPECAHEVLEVGDQVGPTDDVIRTFDAAPERARVALQRMLAIA